LKMIELRQVPGSIDETLAELRVVLADLSSNSQLQERLMRTLGEFDLTLQSFHQLMTTLDEQPNSIIFNRALPDDPVPPAGEK